MKRNKQVKTKLLAMNCSEAGGPIPGVYVELCFIIPMRDSEHGLKLPKHLREIVEDTRIYMKGKGNPIIMTSGSRKKRKR